MHDVFHSKTQATVSISIGLVPTKIKPKSNKKKKKKKKKPKNEIISKIEVSKNKIFFFFSNIDQSLLKKPLMQWSQSICRASYSCPNNLYSLPNELDLPIYSYLINYNFH
jgi:hypothetical protein